MILDLIVAIVIALGFYLGYSRGLIKTIFDSLSIIVAILAALKLSPIMINLIQSVIKASPAISFLLGVVFTFIGMIALIRFIGRKMEDLLIAVHINFINKIAGGTLQALVFAYILSMGIWLINSLHILKEETKAQSITYTLLEPLPEKGKAVFAAIKPLFKDFWDKTIEVMDGVNKENPEK